jgi:hypothetical protein
MEIPPEKWAEGETTTLSVEGGACAPPRAASLFFFVVVAVAVAGMGSFTRVTTPLHHPHRRHV